MKRAVVVDDRDWVAGVEAAERIGVSPRRVHWLLINGHVTPATRTDGSPGLTRDSVEAEAAWRGQASFGQRARRVFSYVFSWSP
jgi:hypothetical protein